MKTIAKLSAILLAAVVWAACPAMAQDATTPSTNTPPAGKAPRAAQFRGIVESIDSTNMILTLKGRGTNPGAKVKITSNTKIKKDAQPGEFKDAVVGMRVQGSGKKGDDGVWMANTLNITKPTPAAKKPAAAPPGQ